MLPALWICHLDIQEGISSPTSLSGVLATTRASGNLMLWKKKLHVRPANNSDGADTQTSSVVIRVACGRALLDIQVS